MYPSPFSGQNPPPYAPAASQGAAYPWGESPFGPDGRFVPAGSGGFAMKWVQIVAVLLGFVGGAMIGGFEGSPTDQGVGLLILAVGILTGLVSSLVWVYQCWSFLPPAYRRTASGRAISPSEAALFNLVPFYNLYWMFVEKLGYCDALDAALIQSGRRARAPKGLAVACCVVMVLPYIGLLSLPLWIALMFRIDGVKAELRDAAR